MNEVERSKTGSAYYKVEGILISTTDVIPGYEIEEFLGIVAGNTVRAKHLGKDIKAAFRAMAGGEVKEYTEMMAQAREEALSRMVKAAKELGANGIIGFRFTSVQTMAGAAEIMAFGTAVKLKPKN